MNSTTASNISENPVVEPIYESLQHGTRGASSLLKRVDEYHSEAIEELRDSVDPACYQAILDGLENDRPVLIDALPAQGKSRGLVLVASDTGKSFTFYTLRHDLYRQFEETCKRIGLKYARIPSQLADCPLGKHYKVTHDKERLEGADEWSKKLDDAYDRFGSSVVAHTHYGKRLPCQKNGDCPFIKSREKFHNHLKEVAEGNEEPYDVIVGNYRHAHTTDENGIPGRYSKGRYAAFDEFPGDAAITELTSGQFQASVNAYLKQNSDLPFRNFGTLENERHLPKHQEEIETWLEDQSVLDEFDATLGQQQSDISPFGPLLTQVALNWKVLGNGYSYAKAGDNCVAAKDGDKDGDVWLLRRPRTQGIAEGVIALEGEPTLPLWNAILPGIEHHPVHPTDAEKRAYLRNELGLRIIQTSLHPKPYASGDWFNPGKTKNQLEGENRAAAKDMLAFQLIIQTEGGEEAPDIISTKEVLDAYEREGVLDLMSDSEHYNNLIGTNDFEETRFGIVSGCNYIGDNVVKMWAVLCGHSIEAKTNEEGDRLAGVNLDFGEFGNQILHAFRENDVLQAVMRFGRKEVNGERGATVYVHTSALPEWVQPEVAVPRVRLWSGSDTKTQVLSVLLDDSDLRNGEWTVTQMAEAVTDAFGEDAKSRKSVKRALDDLSEMSPPLLANEQRTGPGSGRGSGYVYWNLDLESLLEHELGYVLPPPE